jgi:hypothetical protein
VESKIFFRKAFGVGIPVAEGRFMDDSALARSRKRADLCVSSRLGHGCAAPSLAPTVRELCMSISFDPAIAPLSPHIDAGFSLIGLMFVSTAA